MNRLNSISSHLSPNNLSAIGNRTANQAGLFTDNQIAIVTGSGQGIGKATAILFAKNGARVVVTDIDAKKSDEVANEIKANGGEAISVPGDVTDPKFPNRIVEETIKKYGSIHYLVNNAGFTYDGMAHKMDDKQWEIMLLVHQTAPFRLIRAAAPYMRDAGKDEIQAKGKPADRCIINISSTSGTHGNTGQINYSTAKAGVIGMTKTLCKEWGPFGVRCNTIAFGFIDTRLTRPKENGETIEVDGKKVALGIPRGPGAAAGGSSGTSPAVRMIPLQRAGQPEEAAGSIVLLCSPLASYISGQCLEVTGGSAI